MGDQRRIDDCYYANGWFIVKNQGLLNDVFSDKIEDCGVQMVQVDSQEAQESQEEQGQEQQKK